MGVDPKDHQRHEAINSIIVTIRKRICHLERLKSCDPVLIAHLIESRINVEKYLEKKHGVTTRRWDPEPDPMPPDPGVNQMAANS